MRRGMVIRLVVEVIMGVVMVLGLILCLKGIIVVRVVM